MMDCQRLQDSFSDYIDGRLDARMLSVIDSHLNWCDTCREEVQQLRILVTHLHALPPLNPPAYFAHSVRARIAQTPETRKAPWAEWIFPSRQGFALRLAATAILLVALIPPVRRPVVTAGWGLVEAVSGERSATVHNDATSIKPSVVPGAPKILTATTSGMDAGSRLRPTDGGAATTSGSTAQAPTNGSGPAAPAASQTIPVRRPPMGDLSVQFKMNGQTAPGSMMMVNIAVRNNGRRDLFDANVRASVSTGARLVDAAGASLGNSQALWNGNLAAGVPSENPIYLIADRPGVYDLRVESSGEQQSVAADLLIPVGGGSPFVQLDTTSGGPVDLYTALSTLAAESGRPVAVEDGLSGTQAMQIHSTDFQSALSGVTAAFGCNWSLQGGIYHVAIHGR